MRLTRDLQEAAKEIRVAVSLLSPLGQKNPRDTETIRYLAAAEDEFGSIATAQGQLARARETWESAATRMQPVMGATCDPNLLEDLDPPHGASRLP